jgi:nucleotidyltransferase/DNA polymerase involved in DNA repair
MRWILYVDMDAYYVSCELRDRPELAGRPVIVGPDPRLGPTRGVVLSASYEARAFGIRSALPVLQAVRLCPGAVWIPADHAKYDAIAREVRLHLAGRVPRVVALSIDEAACEVDAAGPDEARQAALDLQSSIRTGLRLPASIGAAVHRVVAKIASDRAKPGGVVVVSPEETASFLAPLPIRAVPGVGPKTAERLRLAGVERIGDVLAVRPALVRRAVGSFADELLALARGVPEDHHRDEGGPRSRSAAETFLEDEGDSERLAASLDQLARSLARSLAEERLWFRSVTVAVRWEDFGHGQRSRTMASATDDPGVLAALAARVLAELRAKESAGRRRKIRTLSVSASRLAPAPATQRRLDAFVAGSDRTVKNGARLSDRASS